MKLRALTEDDELPLPTLLDTAFGGPDMYRFAKELRKEKAMAMERVAYDEHDRILGYISYAQMNLPSGSGM